MVQTGITVEMNFFKYSYKQLNLFTLLGGILVLLLVYRQNIKPTLDLYGQCAAMEQQLRKAENAGSRLQVLRSELKRLNKISGNSKLSNEEIRQAILSNTNLFSQQATLTSIKEPHLFSSSQLEVLTHSLDLQGSFKELVNITYDFESRFTDARLSALKLYTVEDNRTKKTSLYGTYYFQNFKKQ